MNYFDNKEQNDFKADFGFMPPHRTKTKCTKPVFADNYLHRIAIMKDFHVGSKGDIDEEGAVGWISKFICTGCGKRYKINKNKSFFHPENSKIPK